MRIVDGEQALVRVFLNESDSWRHRPLYRVLLDRLRDDGFAGATLTRGIAGFGESRTIHTTAIVDLAAALPVVVEIVEQHDSVEKLLRVLDEMVTDHALVTVQTVRAVRYAKRPATRA